MIKNSKFWTVKKNHLHKLLRQIRCIRQIVCFVSIFLGSNMESWAKDQGEGFRVGELEANSWTNSHEMAEVLRAKWPKGRGVEVLRAEWLREQCVKGPKKSKVHFSLSYGLTNVFQYIFIFNAWITCKDHGLTLK